MSSPNWIVTLELEWPALPGEQDAERAFNRLRPALEAMRYTLRILHDGAPHWHRLSTPRLEGEPVPVMATDNMFSNQHPHERNETPIPPVLDSEGRCVICVREVEYAAVREQLAAAQPVPGCLQCPAHSVTPDQSVTCADCGNELTTWYAQVYHNCPKGGDLRRPTQETLDAVSDELARSPMPPR